MLLHVESRPNYFIIKLRICKEIFYNSLNVKIQARLSRSARSSSVSIRHSPLFKLRSRGIPAKLMRSRKVTAWSGEAIILLMW